jgi:transposase
MNLHLIEIAKQVAPGKYAVQLLDQAGWHMLKKLVVPANITLVPLPPKCPELNSVENIIEHCCQAWNRLIDQPWRIMSIGIRKWANGF